MSAQLPLSRKTKDNLPALISAFESETQAVIARTAPYSDRGILHAIAILIVIAIVLMCVLKLDKVVVGAGRIVPTAGSIYVQPMDTAIVRSITVKPGDVVHKGQVLATLDPTFAGADATGLQNKHDSDAAVVARLEAEQAGVAFRAKGSDRYQMLAQADWAQRQAEYRQGVTNLDSQIASTNELRERALSDARQYEEHLKIAADLEKRMTALEQSGYGAPIKTLTARDSRVEAERQLAQARSQAAQAAHDLEALRAQRAVFITKWRDDLANALVTARNDLNTSTQDLVKADRLRDLTSLTAPEDAVVLKIGTASNGSVVGGSAAAEPLFTLTPLNGLVEADMKILSRDVGFVKPGDTVRVKLDAFRYLAHGTAEGVVKTISEGSFTQDENGQPTEPYFKARVRFTKVQLRNVPKDFRLIPGMTLQGDILVGSRTIMSYLIEGGMRGTNEAMREP